MAECVAKASRGGSNSRFSVAGAGRLGSEFVPNSVISGAPVYKHLGFYEPLTIPTTNVPQVPNRGWLPLTFTLTDIGSAIQALTAAQKKVLKFILPPGAELHPFIVEPASAENSFNIGDDTSPARGLFVLHSRFNHSCLPNCKLPDNIQDDTIASFAIRPIDPGEEIVFSYEPDFEARTAADRHSILRFTCTCRACVPGTTFQRCSDLRRQLIRGMNYLIQGVDIDGKRQICRRPLIVDSKLKQAAEHRELELSSIFIYYLLTMALLDSEGLLDHFKLGSLLPCVQTLATLFQTPSNAMIALRAIKQPTAAERLFVGAGLYGQLDSFDRRA
ncbi:hypothetical protein PWT90_02022 [Aphanocladium album]|nr:hypothetical protein PWT90_02022 [Aphanocladium album]